MEKILANKKERKPLNPINPAALGVYFKTSIDDILYDNKFQYLGSGYNRTVLDLHNRFVLKVTEDGMTRSNEVEWQVWNESSPELKKILTPCLIDPENPQKLFMIKAETVNFENLYSFLMEREGAEGAEKILNAVQILTQKFNLFYPDLILAANWGVIEGECRLIDYGCIVEDANE